jgi:hypothetical protein
MVNETAKLAGRAAVVTDGGCTVRRFPDLRHLWARRLGDELAKASRGEVD